MFKQIKTPYFKNQFSSSPRKQAPIHRCFEKCSLSIQLTTICVRRGHHKKNKKFKNFDAGKFFHPEVISLPFRLKFLRTCSVTQLLPQRKTLVPCICQSVTFFFALLLPHTTTSTTTFQVSRVFFHGGRRKLSKNLPTISHFRGSFPVGSSFWGHFFVCMLYFLPFSLGALSLTLTGFSRNYFVIKNSTFPST